MKCRAKHCTKSLSSESGRRQHESRAHDDPIVPYADPVVLNEFYHSYGMSLQEIADYFDVSDKTVMNYIRKYKIETRNRGGTKNDAPFKDKETLERLYVEEGKGSKVIADKFEVSRNTILTWLNKFDIDVRTKEESCRRVGVGYEIASNGYPQWSIHNKHDLAKVKIHTLLAIAKGVDPKEVFANDTVVHHKNGCKFDNRKENLELMSRAEHTKIHQREEKGEL